MPRLDGQPFTQDTSTPSEGSTGQNGVQSIPNVIESQSGSASDSGYGYFAPETLSSNHPILAPPTIHVGHSYKPQGFTLLEFYKSFIVPNGPLLYPPLDPYRTRLR